MDAEGKERAVRFVTAAMRDAHLSEAALVGSSGLDRQTVRSFLSGQRWPTSNNRQALERALEMPAGSIERAAHGHDTPIPEGARQVGDPSEGLVEFSVSGNFGVTATVKGPVSDMAALQAAVSHLIADMQTNSDTREVP